MDQRRQGVIPAPEFGDGYFRHFSHIAPVAKATLSGFGIAGYALAIDGLVASADRKG